jgi:hypothetical protein
MQITAAAMHGILLLATALTLTSVTTVAAAEDHQGVRGSQIPERIHPIKRIYGKENAHVRDAIHQIETESTQYFRTGTRADPSFEVDYANHPFRKRKNRELVTEDESAFEPMRITFVTDSLDSLRNEFNGAKIDFIKGEVLFRMAKFWSETLNVVPVGTLKIQPGELFNGMYCGHPDFTRVPVEHISTGLENTDVVLYVSASSNPQFCGATTLAVAIACNFDDFDRPTAGAINFCLDQIKLDSDGTAHESVIQDNVDVAIHEAAHVFGMSSNSYRYFWDPETGNTRTSRPFRQTTVECVGGATQAVTLPGEDTLQFLTAENGQRFATIVTPKVRAVARNQFDCQDLEGGQLENQPTGSTSCYGDHWDERLYYPESLSGVISPNEVFLSPLTLALFEDSGWYSANYTKSRISPWGHGAGCDFARKPCLDLDASTGVTTVPEYGRGYFCTDNTQKGCSPSHYFKMGCTVFDYSVWPNPPPERFQYFQQETLGGMSQADYCPVFGSLYKNNANDLDCRDEGNSEGYSFFGEEYGTDSMCFESTAGIGSGSGRCYKTACNLQTFKVEVFLGNEWRTCEQDFEQLEIAADVSTVLRASTVTCPRLSSVCPAMFCPANCAGRGVCNFTHVNETDGLVRPKCECFNVTDTSEACSESLPLDGKYIEDSSGLTNRLRRDFFGPLVAVFTDNPNDWDTDSWIWASALLVIFLLLMLCVCSTFCPKKSNKRRRRGARSDEYRSQGPPSSYEHGDSPRRGKVRPQRKEYYD